MASSQFIALIRVPFARGSFVDPPHAQWDAEKDRQLWKVISKSPKTSDLNWVELASKFQVTPEFLLQQAAWLYERHFEHVRNQMKKVSGSGANANANTGASGGSSGGLATGGVAMQRAGSSGAGPQPMNSAMPKERKSSPIPKEAAAPAPVLSRTPSTTTITQSLAQAQKLPAWTQSTRLQRQPIASSRDDELIPSTLAHFESPDSPNLSDSSSSSSSLSYTDHPAHRSQLFKYPPRFQQKRERELSVFAETDGASDVGAKVHGSDDTALPFASSARRVVSGRPYPAQSRTASGKQPSPHSQFTTETASSVASSASIDTVPLAKSPLSPPHRAALANVGSPRGPMRRREGSEGTPSMGSSYSDIDDAGISQSALEEALLSNMQHGRMSTLSRMSRYL